MIKILLVEDDDLSGLVAKMTFEKFHCHIEIAKTMATALAKLNETFQLAVLDLGLPDGDGLTIARFMRKFPAPLGSIPIVILTAHGDEEQKELAFQIGCNGFLIKPLTPELCQEMLQCLVQSPIDKNYFLEN
jgi:CheY-like chemotaxis protein